MKLKLRRMLGPLVLVLAGFIVGASAASAAPTGPGWTEHVIAKPTRFAPGETRVCEETTGQDCAEYLVLVTNATGHAATPPIAIGDTLPVGVSPAEPDAISGFDLARAGNGQDLTSEHKIETEEGVTCTVMPLQCVFSGVSVPAGDTLAVTIAVKLDSFATGTLTDSATVRGGGEGFAPVAASTATAVSSEQASFGVQDFFFEALDEAGGIETQADGRPYSLTSGFFLNTVSGKGEGGHVDFASRELKDVIVELPLGSVGDPLAAQRCTVAQLNSAIATSRVDECPKASRVGTVLFDQGYPHPLASYTSESSNLSDLYNMVPEAGFPAEFGFHILGQAITMQASVVPGVTGYTLRVAVPGVIRDVPVIGAILTFFGDPAAHNGESDSGESSRGQAFFTNPSDCSAGPLGARIEADSWLEPEHWTSAETTAYPQITGCDVLQFNPSIAFTPQTTQADEPSGYNFQLNVPQAPNLIGNFATPPVKEATVALPEGVAISPAAAIGLSGCSAEQIDIGAGGATLHEVGPGEQLGLDGLPHAAPGHCPESSQIGTVTIRTPLLQEELSGHLFLAAPGCGAIGQPVCTSEDAANGTLYSLYLEAEAPGAGVVVKLPGSVSANITTGQLTASFRQNPQLPFSSLEIHLDSGQQAPLANPQGCGTATTTSDLSAWSAPMTPDATPFSKFAVDWNGASEGCPESLPFAPGLLTQSTIPVAGASTPFTLVFSRHDREQDLSQIQVSLPPGLLGEISQVPQCGEPEAASGQCPAASELGTATVEAGSGSRPLSLSGLVYLTGPYEGAPFGLSVAVPVIAGPFNLGTVVVRSAISVNSATAAITVTSDPLPQIIDGVPSRIQTVNVTINRPGFMLNPTSCAQKQVSATILSAQGASAQSARPFAVAGCDGLAFKPSFTAATQGRGSKVDGASLVVKVHQKAGEANIRRVDVQLPSKLPSRLTTLQKACTEAQFNADAAGCPTGSFIGLAVARTPLLNVPLSGPVLLVSHGGEAFPDVVAVLQGEGVTVDLTGETDIKKGITYSHFETVPDAPITSFELKLPESPHSIFASNVPAHPYDLCGMSLKMPTTIVGQNGAVLTQSTKPAVTGCPQANKKRKTKPKRARKPRRVTRTRSSHRAAGRADGRGKP